MTIFSSTIPSLTGRSGPGFHLSNRVERLRTESSTSVSIHQRERNLDSDVLLTVKRRLGCFANIVALAEALGSGLSATESSRPLDGRQSAMQASQTQIGEKQ